MRKRMNLPRSSVALVPAVLFAAGLLTPLPVATAQETSAPEKRNSAPAVGGGSEKNSAPRPAGMTVVEKTPSVRRTTKRTEARTNRVRQPQRTAKTKAATTPTAAVASKQPTAARKTPLQPVPRTFLMTAADTPMLTEKTVTVLTEDNEFATVQFGVATRTLRGEAPAPWEKIEPGDRLRCQGYWDVDGYRFQATVVQVGGRTPEIALDRRIADACKRIGQSRISGGFGVASAAPAPGTPGKALVPSDKPAPGPAAKPGDAAKPAEGEAAGTTAADPAVKPASEAAPPAAKPATAAPGA